jgi:hypothetical protein
LRSAVFGEKSRGRLSGRLGQRMIAGLEHLMADLPEDTPPKLVMSILPRLREQNDQIIAMLREQNELLAKRNTAH